MHRITGSIALAAIIAVLLVLGAFNTPPQQVRADGNGDGTTTPTTGVGTPTTTAALTATATGVVGTPTGVATSTTRYILVATWPCTINGVQAICSMDMEGTFPLTPPGTPATGGGGTPTSTSVPGATGTPSTQVCVEPPDVHYQPTRGQNWPVVAGSNILVVEIWSNQDDGEAAQKLYSLLLMPGQSITILSGGGTIQTYSPNCLDLAQRTLDRLRDPNRTNPARPPLPNGYPYTVR